MKPLSSYFIIALVLISQPACNQVEFKSADDLIQRYITENHVPGFACAVIKNNDSNSCHAIMGEGSNQPGRKHKHLSA